LKPELLIKRIARDGRNPPMPAYQTAGAAALDLSAFISEPVTVSPGERAMVPTGIAVELPEGCAALVLARSGLACRRGLTMMNGVGLIDRDYRGEILVCLYNGGRDPVTVQDGDRIAQLMIVPAVVCAAREAETLSETARGAGGFGSTGVAGAGDGAW